MPRTGHRLPDPALVGLLLAGGCLCLQPWPAWIATVLALELPLGLGLLFAAETRSKLTGSPLFAETRRRQLLLLFAFHVVVGFLLSLLARDPWPFPVMLLLLLPRRAALEGGWAVRRGLSMAVLGPLVLLGSHWLDPSLLTSLSLLLQACSDASGRGQPWRRGGAPGR